MNVVEPEGDTQRVAGGFDVSRHDIVGAQLTPGINRVGCARRALVDRRAASVGLSS